MTQVQEDIKYIKENFGSDYLQLKEFLDDNKLLLFFLTPKMGGKSTYIGFLKELFPNKFKVISAGDLVREIQTMTDNEALLKLQPIFGSETNSVLNDIKTADVKRLVSDQVLYNLLLSSLSNTSDSSLPSNPPARLASESVAGRSVILDGFPRTLEQLSMSWDLANQLTKQGFVPFVLNITVADAVLDKRMASRRVCPNCGLVGNVDTLHTLTIKSVGYDKNTNDYFLTCDKCHIKMIKKGTDTELSEMVERRAREKQVYAQMVKQAQKKGVKYANLKTDVLVSDFVGDDQMLNLSNSYQFRPEGDPPSAEDQFGQISSNTVRFVAQGETGEVYAYHPRYVVGLITKALAKALTNFPNYPN